MRAFVCSLPVRERLLERIRKEVLDQRFPGLREDFERGATKSWIEDQCCSLFIKAKAGDTEQTQARRGNVTLFMFAFH